MGGSRCPSFNDDRAQLAVCFHAQFEMACIEQYQIDESHKDEVLAKEQQRYYNDRSSEVKLNGDKRGDANRWILWILCNLVLRILSYCLSNRRKMDQKQQKVINIDSVIHKLKASEPKSNSRSFPLTADQIQGLCQVFKSITMGQPMLLELNPPIVICGDTHGQYSDLLSIFERIGDPSQRNYLFLGDYVDRGKKSLECYCLLMAMKIKYPLNFFLLRGNHQCSELNKVYGFYDECKQKFNVQIFKIVANTFQYLPVAAVVGDRIFCVHGGLSPLLKDLDEINKIKRPVNSTDNRLLCDLLWSDPNPKGVGWQNNFQRGVSVMYGTRIIDEFLKKHSFDLICRSHQVVQEGYEFINGRSLITVFSAPNYCGQFQNFAGVLKITAEMVCSVEQLKGNLKSSKRVVRRVTPIKHHSQQLHQKGVVLELNQPKRARKATGGSFIFKGDLRDPVIEPQEQPENAV